MSLGLHLTALVFSPLSFVTCVFALCKDGRTHTDLPFPLDPGAPVLDRLCWCLLWYFVVHLPKKLLSWSWIRVSVTVTTGIRTGRAGSVPTLRVRHARIHPLANDWKPPARASEGPLSSQPLIKCHLSTVTTEPFSFSSFFSRTKCEGVRGRCSGRSWRNCPHVPNS